MVSLLCLLCLLGLFPFPVKMLPHRIRLKSVHNSLQFFQAGLTNFCERAKTLQKLLCRPWADAFDVKKLRRQRPAATPFAMKVDRKTMALIPNLLDQTEHR